MLQSLNFLTIVTSLSLLPNAVAPATETGSRVLRKEVIIEAPVNVVWATWTTAEGLKPISPLSRIELRVGGPYEWFLQLDPDEQGRRGSEGSRVLAFLPTEVLAFDWRFPRDIPSLRYSDNRTQVVVQFDDLGDKGTRVRFSQHGWQEGEDWDRGYRYFDEAWTWVLNEMKRQLEQKSPGS